VVGESRNFRGGIDWLRDSGVAVVDLDSDECARLLEDYIARNPRIWAEDIGRGRALTASRRSRRMP
jgi:cytosine/creatinine deaminase